MSVAPIDPALFEPPAMRRALAARNIPVVFGMLTQAGMSQRRIAELTGTQQSEVSAVLRGRQVVSYDVLLRIAEGLGIPRGWMGLAFRSAPSEDDTAYPDDGDHRVGEVDEDVRRRAFLAAASVALFDRPILGELLELPTRPDTPTPLPTELGMGDVTALRSLTERLRVLGRAYGGMADAVSRVATRGERLLGLPGSEPTARALRSALAELHTLAGWCAYDSHLDDHARHHYRRALTLAAHVGDTFRQISTLQHAAIMDRERGAPNDAMKLYQLAEIRLLDIPRNHPRVAGKASWLHLQSASAFALLGRADDARDHLARVGNGRDSQPDVFEQADLDHLRAQVHLALGEHDVAEQLAASSVRTWGPDDRRDSALAQITLATVHARAGEPTTARLTVKAINAVEDIPGSRRAREWLTPLGEALTHSRDSTCHDLAHHIGRLQTP